MGVAFKDLFKLELFHEYFKNSDDEYTKSLDEWNLVPTEETLELFKNYNLIYRKTSDKFIVKYKALVEGEDVSPYIPIVTKTKFRFLLYSKNSNVLHYSDLPLDSGFPNIFYLSNRSDNEQDVDGTDELLVSADTDDAYLSDEDSVVMRRSQFQYEFSKAADSVVFSVEDEDGNVVLSETIDKLDDGTLEAEKNFIAIVDLSGYVAGIYTLKVDTVAVETVYKDDAVFRNVPFAVIEIFYDNTIADAYKFADEDGDVSEKTYTLRINRRETIWKYYVGLKYRTDIDPEDLSITSSDVSATFVRRDTSTLANNLTVVPFDCDPSVIPLSYEAVGGIELNRQVTGMGGGSMETTQLPNPSVLNLKSEDGKIYSEAYIYV